MHPGSCQCSKRGGEIVPASGPKRDEAALRWSLQEIASGGAYLVSEKTVEAVQGVIDTLASSHVTSGGDPYETAGKDYEAAKTALVVVRGEAHRADLRPWVRRLGALRCG